MEVTIKQISEITGVRIPVLAFAMEMEAKLKKNDHKGGWSNCSSEYLINGLQKELDELKSAITRKSRRATIKECADVANFAMMLADNAVIGQL